jgi:hypothetical protein
MQLRRKISDERGQRRTCGPRSSGWQPEGMNDLRRARQANHR